MQKKIRLNIPLIATCLVALGSTNAWAASEACSTECQPNYDSAHGICKDPKTAGTCEDRAKSIRNLCMSECEVKELTKKIEELQKDLEECKSPTVKPNIKFKGVTGDKD